MNLLKTTHNNTNIIINLENVTIFEEYAQNKVKIYFVDDTSTLINENFEVLADELMK